jgi:adenosylcobinamide hydrolase
MRYYTKEGSLILRGLAHAVGSGLPPGGRPCTSFLLAPASQRCPELSGVALATARHGLDPLSTCGLVVDGDTGRTVVAQYDRIMAFALAGGDGVVLVVWTPGRIIPDGDALLATIEETCTVRPSAVVLVSDGGDDGAVRPEPFREAARAAVHEALLRRGERSERPAFIIFSRFGGGHWVEWSPEGCPYYPCHHREDQRCDYCYCPLYPCNDPALGDEVPSSTFGSVWNCSRCTLLHEPAVADHLERNPTASLAELKRVAARR